MGRPGQAGRDPSGTFRVHGTAKQMARRHRRPRPRNDAARPGAGAPAREGSSRRERWCPYPATMPSVVYRPGLAQGRARTGTLSRWVALRFHASTPPASRCPGEPGAALGSQTEPLPAQELAPGCEVCAHRSVRRAAALPLVLTSTAALPHRLTRLRPI